jgi:NMD protein affecting ribosome stability and mRNA decay
MKKFKPRNYYEAKLQIRPQDENLLNFVSFQLKKADIKIIDIVKLKEGFDVYIDSSKFAVKLGRLFKNKYKTKPKITKSLTGENKQKGKRIYKLTVLLRKDDRIK